jgi:hypothetical protein
LKKLILVILMTQIIKTEFMTLNNSLLVAILFLFPVFFSSVAAKDIRLLNRSLTKNGFEENIGQVQGNDAHKVRFALSSSGTKVFLLDDGIAYQFNRWSGSDAIENHFGQGLSDLFQKSSSETSTLETYRMDLRLIGANENAKVIAEHKFSERINYFNQNVSGVSKFGKVTYVDIYPNIDWVVYTTKEGIKYDFVVHPGGNPRNIQLEMNWVEDYAINPDGSLMLGNRLGQVIEKTPVSFQRQMEIPTKFKIVNQIISFELGDYDKNQPLIIDPSLIWGTYYGGNLSERTYGTTVDSSGNVFLTGHTVSTNNIADGGYQMTYGGGIYDAFIVKFNSDGERLWASYYGGTNSDVAFVCRTAPDGSVYVAGSTQSVGGISAGGHQNTLGGLSDAFLVKFDTDGNRLWGTYYGGTANDYGEGLAIASDGSVYLSGSAASTSGIASGGHQTHKQRSTPLHQMPGSVR